MKLVDKIQEARSNKLSDYSKIYTPTAEVIEGIADEFAISFYNWMQDNYYQVSDGFVRDLNIESSKRVTITTEKALEIFKKEL